VSEHNKQKQKLETPIYINKGTKVSLHNGEKNSESESYWLLMAFDLLPMGAGVVVGRGVIGVEQERTLLHRRMHMMGDGGSPCYFDCCAHDLQGSLVHLR